MIAFPKSIQCGTFFNFAAALYTSTIQKSSLWLIKLPKYFFLVLLHSIDDFLQSGEYISAIFKTKFFRFLLNIFYWAETYWLQKNSETMLVVTKKNGYDLNVEKSEQMFINCVENVEEYHNMKVRNTSFLLAQNKNNQNCIHKYIMDKINFGEI